MNESESDNDVSHNGIRVQRLYLQGTSKPYVVDFAQDEETHRPLSVIAGPVSTGKSTVLEFIRYGLGGSSHPTHPEVLAQVVSCLLQITSGSETFVIQRSVGRPSSTASVYQGSIESALAGNVVGRRHVINPPGDPESLSSFLLATVGLEGVQLREAPTQESSDLDPLSFRDIMWLCYIPNERLDDKNLLFENSPMRSLKLRQVLDVVFGVHDDRQAELAERIRRAENELSNARSDLRSTQRFVDEQEPRVLVELELALQLAKDSLTTLDAEARNVDLRIRQATDFASDLRRTLNEANSEARRVGALVRDRESLLIRLNPLRAQYSEDIRKLTMLVEAHDLFDPLRVSACPACFSSLEPPSIVDRTCSLCRSPLPDGLDLTLGSVARADLAKLEDVEDHDAETLDDARTTTASSEIVEGHLRSTRARLAELNEYIDRVEVELRAFEREYDRALSAEDAATRNLEEATTEALSPFLARRDEVGRRREAARNAVEELERSLRLHSGLQQRQQTVGRMETNLAILREQARRQGDLAQEREQVISSVSARFGEILREFGYPKLEMPFVDRRWEPHVRGDSYREASSGARTLLSAAWALSIYETAFERRQAHPGFLMIDSPQKNIGVRSSEGGDFADAELVEGFYRHVTRWLGEQDSGPTGPQIIIVDNEPPTSLDDDSIAVRFTRNISSPPYGLIDNEMPEDPH